MRSHLSNLTTQAHESDVAEDESLLPPPPVELVVETETKVESVEGGEEDMESEDEEEEEPNVQGEHEVAPIASEPPSSSSRDKSVAPACLPVPQSVLDMDKPISSSVVTDYSNGYQTPVQKTAPPQEPWVPQPIPLPRGVLDADKPWNKNESTLKSFPLPSPRSCTNVHDLERESTSESQTARTGRYSAQFRV